MQFQLKFQILLKNVSTEPENVLYITIENQTLEIWVIDEYMVVNASTYGATIYRRWLEMDRNRWTDFVATQKTREDGRYLFEIMMNGAINEAIVVQPLGLPHDPRGYTNVEVYASAFEVPFGGMLRNLRICSADGKYLNKYQYLYTVCLSTYRKLNI